MCQLINFSNLTSLLDVVSGSILNSTNLVFSGRVGVGVGLVNEELSLVFGAVGVAGVGVGLGSSGDELLVEVISSFQSKKSSTTVSTRDTSLMTLSSCLVYILQVKSLWTYHLTTILLLAVWTKMQSNFRISAWIITNFRTAGIQPFFKVLAMIVWMTKYLRPIFFQSKQSVA